jgi:hypothetical protein
MAGRRLAIGLLAVVAMQADGPAAASQASAKAVEHAEFIYDTGPYPQVHASTLAETASGQLVAAWFGGTEEGHDDVAIWVSRHGSGIRPGTRCCSSRGTGRCCSSTRSGRARASGGGW